MAVDFENDVLAQMIDGVEKASQKSSGNVWTFQIKDGQKALVRLLLDLRQAAVLWKHEMYDNTQKRYTVQAVCARHDGVGIEFCKHCVEATRTNSKKLAAKRFFILPVYVYKIVTVKTGQPVTYKNQAGEELPQSGLRLLVLNDRSALLAQLLSNFRELDQGDGLANHDIVIERTDIGGEAVNASYSVIVKTSTSFVAPEGVEIPEQSAQAIIAQMLEKNPPDVIDSDTTDPFGANPPAQSSNGNGTKKAANNVPDF